MNGLRTTVLMVALTLMLVFVGGLIGGRSGMTIALVMAFGMNFVSYWFSDKIVLKMYRAREIGAAEAPELHATVGRLAHKAEIPLPKVYVMDEEQPNAFATGRNPEHGVVAVTTGIMRILSREELEGVLAHELAHIKNRDILVATVAAAIAGAISYLAQMAQWAAIFGGRRDDDGEGSNPDRGSGHDDRGPACRHGDPDGHLPLTRVRRGRGRGGDFAAIRASLRTPCGNCTPPPAASRCTPTRQRPTCSS